MIHDLRTIAIWWLICSGESVMYYIINFLSFNATTTWSVCQFLWKKTVFHFSWFFLFHNIESSIELVCLSSFWLHDTFTTDLTRKVKAQAKLNFTKCLSHPPCLLISSAISFSFSCFLFSLHIYDTMFGWPFTLFKCLASFANSLSLPLMSRGT